jgi:hypothetical protein
MTEPTINEEQLDDISAENEDENNVDVITHSKADNTCKAILPLGRV